MINTVFLIAIINTIVSVFYSGQSIGMGIIGLKFNSNNLKYFKVKIFFREFVLKWGLFFILPIIVIFFKYDGSEIFLNIGTCLLLLPLLFLFLNFLSYFIFKRTILDIITNIQITKQNNNTKNHNSFIASIIDLLLIFSITIIFNRILPQWIFVDFLATFVFITFIYFFISYIFFNKTFGKHCTGIAIVSKNGEKLKFKGIATREISKFLFVFLLPTIYTYLIFRFCGNSIGLNVWYDCSILLYFTIFLCFWGIKKKFCWDIFAKTEKIKQKLTTKAIIVNYSIIIVLLTLVYGFLVFDNNINNVSEQKFLGFNLPFKFKEYPNNSKIKPYTAFLSENNVENPKDYILGLFENNDIVILCEHFHGEDTQWDMISDIVSDERFINKVGNIFTEYGYIKDQEKVNKFLVTFFPNDTLLEKATATLMKYQSVGFYSIMKKINKINNNLPDSLKIIEHFTDILTSNYIYNNKNFLPQQQLIKRDSLMAQVVIDWYNTNNKKCLVITNYRHAFAVNNDAKRKHLSDFEKYFKFNEAQYIYDNFPNKTANVLINPHKIQSFFPLHIPICEGKWETAFKQNNLVPVGFNFKETPFGKDVFDMYPTSGVNINLKYQDIFTGLVFYKPHSQLTTSSPLYEKYGAEQEYKYLI
ncbi:MAG: RDD family protein, partial [Bacteroidales bacterium]|nr:RDD family protein [Bacteroidales bacterium]